MSVMFATTSKTALFRRPISKTTVPQPGSHNTAAGLPLFLKNKQVDSAARGSAARSSPATLSSDLTNRSPELAISPYDDGTVVHRMAKQGVSDEQEALPYLDTIQRAFGPLHNLTGIHAHIGGQAETVSARLNAQAYAVGNDIAFASSPDLRLAAHEATHVIQQRNGVSLSSGVGQADDRYEQHADAVADRVCSGRTAVDLLSATSQSNGAASSQGSASPAVQMQPVSSTSAQMSKANPTDTLLSILYLRDPDTGDPGYHSAVLAMDRMEMPDLLHALDDLARKNMLTGLFPHIGGPFDYDQGRIVTAMRIVRLKHTELGTFSGWEAAFMARHTAELPPDEQQAIIDYLTDGFNYRDFARLSKEGASVLGVDPSEAASSFAEDEADQDEDADSSFLPESQNMSVAMGAAPPVSGPGFWRPGKQPPGYYIGNTAHLAIAAIYTSAHPGDIVYTNFISVQKIVNDFAAMELFDAVPFRLSKTQLEGEPDIANLTLHHLYEIKPAGSEMLAFEEAEEYCESLTLAGVPMRPGPMFEPGTFGFFYDAGWYFVFNSPLPGVIVYRRQLLPPPEPEPQEQEEWESDPIRLPVFKRQTQEQTKAAEETGVAGGILMFLAALAALATA